jgi:dihydropteroate synthase
MDRSARSAWTERPPFVVPLPDGRKLDLSGRPLVMGVLNVTPDSFSDGGMFDDRESAVGHALQMCEEGAEIIDVGGESTRPGSAPVDTDEELERVVPVIEQIAARTTVPISIDTQKAEVAARALEAGALIVNDVSALRTDPEMAAVAAAGRAGVVLMHMQGTPRTMQQQPTYDNVVTEVREWLAARVDTAVQAGIARNRIIVDPGFGFGKRLEHNLALLRELHTFHQVGAPVLVGTSRKSMLGAILDRPPAGRLHGTLATVACAAMSGCHVMRVHDVGPAREVLAVCEAVRSGRLPT